MGVTYDGFDRVQRKLETFFDDFSADLGALGEVAAEGIVQNTLAGLGPDDQPFAPYSDSYQKLIDSVGGKPQGTVNLRGVFLKDGQTNPKFRSADRRRLSGADRGSYVTVSVGDRTFQAKTRLTRPAMGLTDPRSEMSLDLIKVETDDHSFTLKYTPRSAEYMIYHQNGDGRLPQRQWFTLRRSAIQGALQKSLQALLGARIQRFNDSR